MAKSLRTEAVIETIRSKIANRHLAANERLPSIRRMAASMAVSPSTVVEAYGRLVADGTIRSRPGSGFYVCNATAPLMLARTGPHLDRAVDSLWVSRQALDAGPDMIKPGCGWMPSDWMPGDLMRKATREALRNANATGGDYGDTRGLADLRQLLARHLSVEAADTHPDQIMLCVSATQAVDLICRFLLRAGDTVLVDDPCYFNFQALLRVHETNVVSVPYTPAGPDLERLRQVLSDHRPRLYITNSALQNPTGATIAPHVAHRVLSACADHDVTVVEDDIFAPFEPEPSPRLSTLDGYDRVIRIASFSKSLSASVRCGFIAARSDWIDALIDLQVATNFVGPGPFAAAIIGAALADNGYRRHLDDLRGRLDRARRQVAARLGALDIEPWTLPRGGFYLWCRLPDGVDAATVARLALRENVVLAPGNVFSPSQTMGDFMRFNVTQMGGESTFGILKDAIVKSGEAGKFDSD